MGDVVLDYLLADVDMLVRLCAQAPPGAPRGALPGAPHGALFVVRRRPLERSDRSHDTIPVARAVFRCTEVRIRTTGVRPHRRSFGSVSAGGVLSLVAAFAF